MSDAMSVAHDQTAEYCSASDVVISRFRCHAPANGSRTTGDQPPLARGLTVARPRGACFTRPNNDLIQVIGFMGEAPRDG